MNLAPPKDDFKRTLPARWAAIDFETTGIWDRDPSTGVIEAAVVIYEGAREVSAWSTLVYPETAISDFIINLTKITPEMIDAAGVDRGVARQQMTDVLQGAEWVIAHNMQFAGGEKAQSFVFRHGRKPIWRTRSQRFVAIEAVVAPVGIGMCALLLAGGVVVHDAATYGGASAG
jgi:DNA polymerase III epsilon subunit-like protein